MLVDTSGGSVCETVEGGALAHPWARDISWHQPFHPVERAHHTWEIEDSRVLHSILALGFMGIGFLLAVACCRGDGTSIFGGSAKTRSGPVGAAFDPNDRLKRVSSLNSVWNAVGESRVERSGKARGHKRSDSIDSALIRNLTQPRASASEESTMMRPRLDSSGSDELNT